MARKIEILIVILSSVILLAVSFYPLYYRYQTTPSGRVYAGTVYYTADYAGYVSAINQGINGKILHTDKFTSEKMPDTLLYYPYLLLGQIGGIFNLDAIVVYHLSRFLFSLIYLLLTYLLIKQIFKGETKEAVIKRISSFLLAIFAAAWPIITSSGITVPALSRVSAEIQVNNRFVIQPHFLLANIALLLCLIIFFKYEEKHRRLLSFVSGLIIFLITFFRGSHSLFFLTILLVYLIWLFLKKEKKVYQTGEFFLVNLIFFLPPFFYLYFLKQQYPQLPYFQYDLGHLTIFPFKEVILLGGPTFLLSFFSWWLVFKKKTENRINFLLLWTIIWPFYLLIFPIFYPLNPLRFLQTPYFIIFGILASWVIFKTLRNLYLVLGIIFLIFTISLPVIINDFNHEVHLYYDAYYIWPPKNYLPALDYLKNNSRPDQIVLTYLSLANLVPIYSGNTVYFGHTNETLNYDEKQKLVEKFYQGKMNDSEAKDFLQKNNIKWVLVGREEKSLGEMKYPQLRKVYGNSDIEIFRMDDR